MLHDPPQGRPRTMCVLPARSLSAPGYAGPFTAQKNVFTAAANTPQAARHILTHASSARRPSQMAAERADSARLTVPLLDVSDANVRRSLANTARKNSVRWSALTDQPLDFVAAPVTASTSNTAPSAAQATSRNLLLASEPARSVATRSNLVGKTRSGLATAPANVNSKAGKPGQWCRVSSAARKRGSTKA